MAPVSYFDTLIDDKPAFEFHGGVPISGLTAQTNRLGALLFHGHDVARAVNAPWELPERDMLLMSSWPGNLLANPNALIEMGSTSAN
jgi:hypothetical protein